MGTDLATAAPCDVQIRDAVGTSELHPVAHAVALRYVKRPLAKPKEHRAKIQSESRRWPEFAIAPPRPRKRQTPARSASHGERDAQPAAEPARVVTIHVYTRLEKPAPDARRRSSVARASTNRRLTPATALPRAIPRFSDEQPPSHVTGPRGAAVAVSRQRDAAAVDIEPHAGESREESGTEKK